MIWHPFRPPLGMVGAVTADQWTTVFAAAPLLVAIIGAAWTLSARLTGIGARVTSLEGRVEGLERDTGHDLAGIKGTLATLMAALVQGKALSEGAALEAALAPWQQQIQRERQHPNPLTAEELSRFEHYYEKVSKRQAIEQSEFQDYQSIADKLYRERPKDPSIWFWSGWARYCSPWG